MDQPGSWFLFGCLFEATLGLVGLLLGVVIGLPLRSFIRLTAVGALLGIAVTFPLLVALILVAKAPWAWARAILAFLEVYLRPVFGRWSVAQLGLISLLAGAGEELLFRGVLQAGLSQWCGPALALVLASALFGCVHAVTRSYAVLAGIIGMYLGLLWIWSGNLLVPMVAHALYDFIALLYFLRVLRAPLCEPHRKG